MVNPLVICAISLLLSNSVVDGTTTTTSTPTEATTTMTAISTISTITSTSASNVTDTTTASPLQTYITIGLDSLGYTLTFVSIAVLFSLYTIYWLTRLVRSNRLLDNKVYIPDLQLTQRGYVFSRFGLILQVLTSLFGVWLVVAMTMSIIGHYANQWPFDLSLGQGTVDWDSFTRVFLSAWIALVIYITILKSARRRIHSFFLRPSSLARAEWVKMSQVMRVDGRDVLHQEVVRVSKPIGGGGKNKRVEFMLQKFVWSERDNMYVGAQFFTAGVVPTIAELEKIRASGGLPSGVASDRSTLFGRNEIILTTPTFSTLLLNELTSTFNLYQILGQCLLSLYWDYVSAGIFSFCLIFGSAASKAAMELREQKRMKEVGTMHGSVWVCRETHWTKIQSEELVVGDLVCVTTDSVETTRVVVADIVLVAGTAVVDESGVTGATMPVDKVAVGGKAEVKVDWRKDEILTQNILLAGSSVVQGMGALDDGKPGSVASAAIGVVVAVGANTTRAKLGLASQRSRIGQGDLMGSEFVVAVTVLVIVGFGLFLVVVGDVSVSTASMLPALTCVVTIISPLLSVALSGGEIRAANRLLTSGIHTKNLRALTAAGKCNLAFLDKTGTLTHQGLEFRGVVPVSSLRLTECVNRDSPVGAELSACLALAHSVSRSNGELVGHRAELGMVEAATKLGWKFGQDVRAPTDPSGSVWEVERVFGFDGMRTSAVVKQVFSGKRFVVCKGSFERVTERCTHEVSTDVSQAVIIYAQEGCYVLAVAIKEISPEGDIGERSAVESDLALEGLIVFRNEIKADSAAAVEKLGKAGIESIMLTGDSVYTAAAVARSVGLISPAARTVLGVVDERTKLVEWKLADTDSLISEESLAHDRAGTVLCITGEVFDALRIQGKLEPDRVKVYARVTPVQKSEIVQMYADSGKVTVMCGDGPNDSTALQTAHASLTISSKSSKGCAEVASSFSTDSDSLQSLLVLIKEARGALTTSLAAYRFLVCVGIIGAVTKVSLLLQCGGYITGTASFFIDWLLVPVMLYCICSALPEQVLASTAPEGSLLGPEMILGITWTLICSLTALGIAEGIMINSPAWFEPFTTTAALSSWNQRTDSFEAALIVVFKIWTFVDIAFVSSYGSIHRQAMMKNWRLVVVGIGIGAMLGWCLFGPVGTLQVALMVQATEAANAAASNTWLNYFLFYYEQIGRAWNGVGSTIEFPVEFRVWILVILFLTSVVHHVGFRLSVLGAVGRWFHAQGWIDGSCSCCRRRRSRGYTSLSINTKAFDALDESILSAGEQDSPAAEWELRRTYGRWRAPTDPEYK